MKVSLTNDLREFVREKVASGQFSSEEAVLREALQRFQREDRETVEGWLDTDAIESCARELEGKIVPSIEEVREALAKIPGSMAQAVIEEREERF